MCGDVYSRNKLLENGIPGPIFEESETSWRVTGYIPCTTHNLTGVRDASTVVLDLVSFTDSDAFQVVRHDEKPHDAMTAGQDLVFFNRMAPMITLKMLFVVTMCIVGVRTLISTITRNDLHLGLALLVKDVLELPLLDSTLQDKQLVDYSKPIARKLIKSDNTCKNDEV